MFQGLGKGTRRPAAAPLSLIGADVAFEGNIITEGEIQIDGRLKGDILCRRLLIGDTGRIEGEITAETLQVHGEVVGRISASKVVIARSARVSGDIVHDSVEIEAGARLDGRLIPKTGANPQPAAEPALPAVAEPARLAPPAKAGKATGTPPAAGETSAATPTAPGAGLPGDLAPGAA